MKQSKNQPNNMDSLTQLQRRKAALSAKLELQRSELKDTLLDLRQEIEPSKILGKALGGIFGLSGKGGAANTIGATGQLPAPIAFVMDVLLRDSRWAFLLKWAVPLVLRFWAKSSATTVPLGDTSPSKPLKSRFYGQLRRGVSSLRTQIRKPATTSEPTPTVDLQN